MKGIFTQSDVGLPFGVLGLAIGILKDNYLYLMGGIGITLMAIVGILEILYGAKNK